MKARIRTLALALPLCLASCSGEPTGDPAAAISDEDRAYGAQQHPQLLAEFGGAYPGGQAGYLKAVGERVATAAGLDGQCTFTMVNSDVVNAFAVPGCYIYVTRGLFAVVTSEAELASVLGHEVGHVVAQHSQRQERRSVWRTLGVIAVSLTGSDRLTRLASQAAQYFGLRYSRTQEYQADDLGVGYLEKAGYDVYAAAEMLADLQRQEAFVQATGARDAARSIPEWALSHPLTQNRIERARKRAEATGLQDDALPENAAAYYARVDGLLYGDDPQQGFVIDRRFAHPVMRITFEAPPGFSLTNSPQAVGLNGPDGVRGEFGGGPMPAGGLPRYAEALVAQVVGDAPAQVRSSQAAEINGLPAVIVQVALQVRQGTVPLAIAAYDGGGGEAYHFIMISPPSDAHAAALAALFGSFRRLSPQEAASLRPRVIRTVRARAGDTADALSRQTVDRNPRALFALLNGDAKGALAPGAMVKIVTYAGVR
ncbi:M48 family metalloprotease [Novosphingobium sp. 9U]|uniref:M48 family metalloprotease n=1 Tax=Novosphingobium sp. 9U TaxID=2653158 RepID=UPI0012F2C8F0|nr:M48 family metalloprotease [Novosphingobium sp. 9U]VWX55044.1 Beta-barrel assembly-enhancing protease [Novosphingobium sp. 9U]